MAENIGSIEVKTQGTTRVLKIGDLTITIDQSKREELESPPGILFDFDGLLAKLIVLFDQSDASIPRDALLTLRSQLADEPELMQTLQKLCAMCVVIEPDFQIVPRELFEKMHGIVNDVAKSAREVDQRPPRRRAGFLGTDTK
jgi:hypothetical protein